MLDQKNAIVLKKLIKDGFINIESAMVYDEGVLQTETTFLIAANSRKRETVKINFCPVTGQELSGLTLAMIENAANGQPFFEETEVE